MYAYVDESGNTGNRVFDPDQPLFLTAAMMTKGNFDILRKPDLTRIAKKAGVEALHANVLGTAKIEAIADDLLKIIKQTDAYFFLSRVEKSYLVAAKVFDTYFDPFDNKAVPWTAYNLRPLRLTLTFKIAACVLTIESANIFWEGIVATREERTRERFVVAAELMLAKVNNIPDPRSRQIVRDGFEWALANPENFSIHIRDKVNRNSHSPNFVAFTNLMDGIDGRSKVWSSPVREIVHDRQSEFEKTFRHWHAVRSRPELAAEKPVYWFGDEIPMTIGAVPGSNLRIATEETSPGLQVTDVVLWLFKRTLSEKEIGPRATRLLNRVFLRGLQNDFSFAGVGGKLEDKLDTVMDAPVTNEQMEFARDFMAKAESRRRAAMVEYAAEKTSSANEVSPGEQ